MPCCTTIHKLLGGGFPAKHLQVSVSCEIFIKTGLIMKPVETGSLYRENMIEGWPSHPPGDFLVPDQIYMWTWACWLPHSSPSLTWASVPRPFTSSISSLILPMQFYGDFMVYINIFLSIGFRQNQNASAVKTPGWSQLCLGMHPSMDSWSQSLFLRLLALPTGHLILDLPLSLHSHVDTWAIMWGPSSKEGRAHTSVIILMPISNHFKKKSGYR